MIHPAGRRRRGGAPADDSIAGRLPTMLARAIHRRPGKHEGRESMRTGNGRCASIATRRWPIAAQALAFLAADDDRLRPLPRAHRAVADRAQAGLGQRLSSAPCSTICWRRDAVAGRIRRGGGDCAGIAGSRASSAALT